MPESSPPERPGRAIILIAGGGGRLRPLTDHQPKGLLEVGGRALVEHQIACLRWAGIEAIALVTGHGAAHVRARCGDAVSYIHNERFRETNSLYSAALAADFGRGGCLILNSDVLFHPALLERLLAAPWPDAILVDRASRLGEEEMKVVTAPDGRVRRISKAIDPAQAHGENLGIVRLGPTGAGLYFDLAVEAAERGEWNHWVPYAIDRLCSTHPFHAVATDGLPWIEIDYPADLAAAREEVYPRLLPQIRAVQMSREAATMQE